MINIVMIDDEKDFCFFIKKNLEMRGDYNVTLCFDGTQGYDVVRKIRPDVVFLDIIMPGVTGAEIAEKIRSNESTKHTPFIFLTAVVSEEETRSRKDVIGGNYFIAKPVKIDKLINAINECVEKEQK